MPKSSKAVDSDDGRYAYDGLDRVLHEKGRLAIMTSLATNADGLLFGDLKRLTSMTDGNLSRHLDVLQEAKFVQIWKGREGNRPQTLVRSTPLGKRKFLDYLKELERVIQDARSREQEAAAESGGQAPIRKGWAPA